MSKVHANKLHAKLGHPEEYKMLRTAHQLHYSIKEVIEVFEDCATAKIKQKFLHKVAEESNLKPGEMTYVDIISQKKSSYGGSKNWVLIQYCDTQQQQKFFTKTKEYLSENLPLS